MSVTHIDPDIERSRIAAEVLKYWTLIGESGMTEDRPRSRVCRRVIDRTKAALPTPAND